MVGAMSTLLRVAYDGGDFHGFARQTAAGGEAPRTVQGALEEALGGLYGAPVMVRGASRTDAGVHALGQLVAFDGPFSIPPRGVLMGLQGRLPADLGALAAWEEERAGGAPVEPRHENGGKHYRYVIRTTAIRSPRTGRYEWHLHRPLDVAAMQEAAVHLVGEHDFASFRGAGCQARTTVRRLVEVSVRGEAEPEPWPEDLRAVPQEGPPRVVVDVRGEAFLYNMVRILVGTLVEVGQGRRTPASVAEALARRDRRAAGVTAPAQGLTLMEVVWPGGGRGVRE